MNSIFNKRSKIEEMILINSIKEDIKNGHPLGLARRYPEYTTTSMNMLDGLYCQDIHIECLKSHSEIMINKHIENERMNILNITPKDLIDYMVL